MIVNKTKILGQYFTPLPLAIDIVSATKYLYCQNNIDILEPAFGKGAFLSALRNEGIDYADFLGIEIDNTLNTAPDICLNVGDFTEILPDKQYDLIITNPPYTRHHLIEKEQKERMAIKIYNELGIKINGLSGLHCYFILLADKWLKENGIAVWLLPTEFLDITYGKQIKDYLLNNVQLLKVHIYNTNYNSLFNNATVSSCVIVYRKSKPNSKQDVVFTFGDSMNLPEKQIMFSLDILSNTQKWLKLIDNSVINTDKKEVDNHCLSDYFSIKRGIATGCNKYFILSKSEIEEKGLPLHCFTPIIENAKNIVSPTIESDENGLPLNNNLFVLDTSLSIEEIEHIYPKLYEYLLYGLKLGIPNRYLVSKRKIWYKQENRCPAPFYCSYIARSRNGNGFRFIWNKSISIVTNNFLMLYPKQKLVDALNHNLITDELIFEKLAHIASENFVKQSRSYATGLYKLEPSELCKVELNLEI